MQESVGSHLSSVPPSPRVSLSAVCVHRRHVQRKLPTLNHARADIGPESFDFISNVIRTIFQSWCGASGMNHRGPRNPVASGWVLGDPPLPPPQELNQHIFYIHKKMCELLHV